MSYTNHPQKYHYPDVVHQQSFCYDTGFSVPSPLESDYGSSHALSHRSDSQSSSSSYDAYYPNSPGYPQEVIINPNRPKNLEGIKVDLTEPASSVKKSKQRHSGSTSPGIPSIYPCLWVYEDKDKDKNKKKNCNYTTTRHYDLKRHMNGHSKSETFPCPHEWCGRDERDPFSRRDHLEVHLRTVHMGGRPKKEKRTTKDSKMSSR